MKTVSFIHSFCHQTTCTPARWWRRDKGELRNNLDTIIFRWALWNGFLLVNAWRFMHSASPSSKWHSPLPKVTDKPSLFYLFRLNLPNKVEFTWSNQTFCSLSLKCFLRFRCSPHRRNELPLHWRSCSFQQEKNKLKSSVLFIGMILRKLIAMKTFVGVLLHAVGNFFCGELLSWAWHLLR